MRITSEIILIKVYVSKREENQISIIPIRLFLNNNPITHLINLGSRSKYKNIII